MTRRIGVQRGLHRPEHVEEPEGQNRHVVTVTPGNRVHLGSQLAGRVGADRTRYEALVLGQGVVGTVD